MADNNSTGSAGVAAAVATAAPKAKAAPASSTQAPASTGSQGAAAGGGAASPPGQVAQPASTSGSSKKSSKTILWVLLGCGGLVILCIIGGAILSFFSGSSGDDEKDDEDKDSEEEEVKIPSYLESVETPDYIFYYPDEFESETAAGLEQLFLSTETNTLGGHNSINLEKGAKTTIDVFSSVTCSTRGALVISQYATILGVETSDIKNTRADYEKNDSLRSCDIGLEIDTPNGKTYSDQIYFNKQGEDDVFVVTLTYDKNSGDEYDQLKDSAKYFDVK